MLLVEPWQMIFEEQYLLWLKLSRLYVFQTAEMPGFYADGEYDLSGFAVGVLKKDSVIDGKNITVGDVLIGLPSSGVHSNGFSLVRRFGDALMES